MRILSRYVFREIFTSALLGTVLATFVIFLQGPGKALFELLVRTSARPDTVLRLFVYSLPSVLPLTIPFGVSAIPSANPLRRASILTSCPLR